jgi:hypothetical protein
LLAVGQCLADKRLYRLDRRLKGLGFSNNQ